MTYTSIKFLPPMRVSLTSDFEFLDDRPSEDIDLSQGVVVGVNLLNIDDPEEGVEYTVRFGDWVLEGCKEEYLTRS